MHCVHDTVHVVCSRVLLDASASQAELTLWQGWAIQHCSTLPPSFLVSCSGAIALGGRAVVVAGGLRIC